MILSLLDHQLWRLYRDGGFATANTTNMIMAANATRAYERDNVKTKPSTRSAPAS